MSNDDLAQLRTHPDYDVDEMRSVHAPPARTPLSFPESRSIALQAADLWEVPRELPPDPIDDRLALAELEALAGRAPNPNSVRQAYATLLEMLTWHQAQLAILEPLRTDQDAAHTAELTRRNLAALDGARQVLNDHLALLHQGANQAHRP